MTLAIALTTLSVVIASAISAWRGMPPKEAVDPDELVRRWKDGAR